MKSIEPIYISIGMVQAVQQYIIPDGVVRYLLLLLTDAHLHCLSRALILSVSALS
jgi:hypothetical protein